MYYHFIIVLVVLQTVYLVPLRRRTGHGHATRSGTNLYVRRTQRQHAPVLKSASSSLPELLQNYTSLPAGRQRQHPRQPSDLPKGLFELNPTYMFKGVLYTKKFITDVWCRAREEDFGEYAGIGRSARLTWIGENVISSLPYGQTNNITIVIVSGNPPASVSMFSKKPQPIKRPRHEVTWLVYNMRDTEQFLMRRFYVLYKTISTTTTTKTPSTEKTFQVYAMDGGATENDDGADTAADGGSDTQDSELRTTTPVSGATTTGATLTTEAARSERNWLRAQAPYVTAVVAAVAILGCLYCLYKQRAALGALGHGAGAGPEQWRAGGALAALHVYPVKSCAPAPPLARAQCTMLGLCDEWLIRDRFLMVVDAHGRHVSARVAPELLAVRPARATGTSILTLHHDRMEPLHVNLADVQQAGNLEKAKVCDVSVRVWHCGRTASEWFTRLLQDRCQGNTCRLVYYASDTGRRLRPDKHNIYQFTKHETGALSNEAPFHLINEASLAELNSRLKGHRVSVRNFRPNFVLSGAEAFAEDRWKFIRIGQCDFQVTKPCNRCVLTTLDPDTGAQNSEFEPLTTLRSYRQSESPQVGPRMGVQLALRSAPGGVVSVGDPVLVAEGPCWCQHESCPEKGEPSAGGREGSAAGGAGETRRYLDSDSSQGQRPARGVTSTRQAGGLHAGTQMSRHVTPTNAIQSQAVAPHSCECIHCSKKQ